MAHNRLLIINPGSTSTKISVFDDDRCLFTESVFHDAPVLLKYPTTNDQMPFRAQVIRDILERHAVDIGSINVWVGRGGCAYSQRSGVMEIDELLVRDTAADKGGSDHPAKLGVMLAYEFCSQYGGKMFTMNPTNVDELCDYARITGISGVYKRAQTHVLNQKAIAKIHANKLGRSYQNCSFIVCHIDGGITITAHRNGLMVDSTEGAGGDGPFSPTRLGSIPVMELANYMESHTPEDLRTMCSRSGGLVSHFGTSNADTIHRMVEEGDEKAKTIWGAMVYQICKSMEMDIPLVIHMRNAELKPESTTSWEVGLEMSLLDNRLGFDVTYYSTNTKDEILPLSVSGATGYLYKYINCCIFFIGTCLSCSLYKSV